MFCRSTTPLLLRYTPTLIRSTRIPSQPTASLAESAILSSFTPSHLVQVSLSGIHHLTGLPYWASIVLFTIGLRITVMPVTLYARKHMIRMKNIQPEWERFESLRRGAKTQKDKDAASDKIDKLWKIHKTHPGLSIIGPLAQMPVFITLLVALRNPGPVIESGLAAGGMLWFPNLNLPDPYWILPVINSGVFLLALEHGADSGAMQTSQMTKWIMRSFAVGMVPIGHMLPQAVLLFWLTSSAAALAMAPIVKLPKVKATFGIPDPIVRPTKLVGAKAIPKAPKGPPPQTFTTRPRRTGRC